MGPGAVQAGGNPSHHPWDQITLDMFAVWSCQCSGQSDTGAGVCQDVAEQGENAAEFLHSKHVINY